MQIKQMRSILFFCFIFLSSCLKKESQKKSFVISINQQEAMLVDIPLPLYEKRLVFLEDNVEIDKNVTLFIGYRTLSSMDDIIIFYTHEMERYGWNLLKLFKGCGESLLQFESPKRWCTVSIRPYGNKSKKSSDLFIFVGNKE